MQTIQKQLLLSLIISSNSLLTASPSIFEKWEEMESFRQRMHKSMSDFRDEMRNSMQSLKEVPSISMKMTNAGVQISIPHIGLKDRNFEAQFDQENNVLAISTPNGAISIQARTRSGKQTYISAILKHQEQQELEKDKGTNIFSSHSQVSHIIEGEIEMAQSEIEYDSQTQELIITIPQRKRLFTKIPVNFKEPKETK